MRILLLVLFGLSACSTVNPVRDSNFLGYVKGKTFYKDTTLPEGEATGQLNHPDNIVSVDKKGDFTLTKTAIDTTETVSGITLDPILATADTTFTFEGADAGPLGGNNGISKAIYSFPAKETGKEEVTVYVLLQADRTDGTVRQSIDMTDPDAPITNRIVRRESFELTTPNATANATFNTNLNELLTQNSGVTTVPVSTIPEVITNQI